MELLAFALGVYLLLFLIPFIPGLVEFLSINPNRYRRKAREVASDDVIRARDYKPSRFGFFTYIPPGHVKIIERGGDHGGRFIRCIMAYDHHMFRGETPGSTFTPKHAEYWEVVKTPLPVFGIPRCHDSHPIPFPEVKWNIPLTFMWWVWKRWVYLINGAVFIGFPFYQGPRVYPMERFNRVTRADGKVDLVRKEDYSDHYRVAHFQYPALISRAFTQGNLPVDVLLNEVAAVFNPYMVAYNTDDDWPTRFLGSVSNRTTSFTRTRPLNKVLTAEDPTAANELADFITLGGKHLTEEEKAAGMTTPEGSTSLIGIKIIESQVLKVSLSNTTDEAPLGNETRAKIQRRADEESAIGKAAYVREEGKALQEHPYADVVVQTEGMVRAAEAAGKAGGIVILGGQSFDPAQAAILKELREFNKTKGGTTT